MEKDIKKTEEVNPPVKTEEKPTAKQPVEEQPKPKKKKGCCFGCLIAFLVVLVIILAFGAFAFFRFRAIAKTLGTQQNLGITYTQKDYESFLKKLGMSETAPQNDSVKIDTTILSREITAMANITGTNTPIGTLSNTQIRFGNNNIIEISTLLEFNGKPIALYISATLVKATNKTLTGDVKEIRIGQQRLPIIINRIAAEQLFPILNQSLASLGDTLRIDTFQISNAGARIKGIIPIGN